MKPPPSLAIVSKYPLRARSMWVEAKVVAVAVLLSFLAA